VRIKVIGHINDTGMWIKNGVNKVKKGVWG
jgi:hypothetical protein